MSRPIAYNASGPLSGSIRGGNVNYTVDSGNRDYTTFASKKWVPSADGAAPIVFVTDTYTQGFELNPSLAVPLFYSCNGTGSAAIIYTANRIPGSPGNYSDANVALNDLISARGYFILESNDPYQGDYQSGNLLTLDASKMSSYPQTGTNFYDLSGNDFDFSLLNGPTFNSSGWFNMDATDDSIGLTSNTTLKTTNTLVMWVRTTDTTGLLLTGQPPGTTGGYYVAAYYPGVGFYSGTAGSPDYFMDTLATVNPATPINYLDGRFHMWEVKGLNFGAWTNDWYFLSYAAGYQIAGDVAKIKMFNSYLTAAQSKQLYFGSPIVTDGLVFAVDANNIVSYPKSGTSAYNLTGSGTTGTLTNGPTFQLPQGGYWAFDGTDDYINFGNIINLGTSDFTLSVWVYIPSGTASTFRAILNKKGASGADAGYGMYYNTGMQKFLWSTANGSSASEVFTSNTFASIENTWANVVMVRQSGATNNGHYYVNGVYQSIAGAATILNVDSSVNLSLAVAGSTYTPYCFQGNIANSKIYNRALSAAEIQQNYQAEQYRFETPAGPVTNGLLLYWDAGNLDSYPGTGTTIYDLSGNSNNGTLYNGVGFNQTNGGVLVFDGIDDYVQNNTLNLAATDCTVIGISRYTSVNTGVYQGGGRIINARNNNWLMGHWDRSAMKYYAQGWVTDSDGTEGMPDTNWHFYHTFNQYSTDSWSFYIDNVLDASNSNGSEGPNGFSIGMYGNTFSEYSKSNFSVLLAYNRILSAAEITQVYNYFKGRFGL